MKLLFSLALLFFVKKSFGIPRYAHTSRFAKIDTNDIKRVKWGLTSYQNYPESVQPAMNDDEFRRIIRSATNYHMCISNVIFEEMPAAQCLKIRKK